MIVLGILGGKKAAPSIIIDSFDRADGALGGNWIAPTWTIGTNKALNTPVGTELVANSSLTTWADGLPVGFTGYALIPGTHEVNQVAPTEGHGGVGTGAANIWASAGGHGLRTAEFTAKTASWLKLLFTESKRVSGDLNANIGYDLIRSTEGAKVQTCWGGNTFAGFYSSGAGVDVTIDDISLNEIGLSELSAFQLAYQSDSRISVSILIDALDKQAGIIFADSPTNPQNGIIAYLSPRTSFPRLIVDKILNGVRSNLATLTISYANMAQEHTLVLHKVAGKYYVRYINLVASSYAERLNSSVDVTDAAILGCKYFGIFSPDQNITFNDFSLFPTTKVHNTFWVGDSKLSQSYNNCPYYFTSATSAFEEAPERQAVAGDTMALAKSRIDDSIAAAVETPELVFFNVGVNDANAVPVTDETQFKADMQYILDAIHTAWASAKVYIMAGVYRTSKPTECATVSGWIRTVMGNNPTFCYEWADELVWYAPNMATYSSDAVHYSVAGSQEAARLGRVASGFA